MRLLVALLIALSTAGTAGGTPISLTPVGRLSLETM